MMQTAEQEFGLLLPFTDDSHSFCHGFEAGQVWSELTARRSVRRRVVHRANLDQFKGVARSLRLRFDWVETDSPEWIEVSFRPTTLVQVVLFALRWLTW